MFLGLPVLQCLSMLEVAAVLRSERSSTRIVSRKSTRGSTTSLTVRNLQSLDKYSMAQSQDCWPGASFGGRGSNQARDLVQAKVILVSYFTPRLNQVTWFGSKSCKNRLIAVHAMHNGR